MNPHHALIISHDVVGSRMAGPGIRYWEMARVLARQQPVTLVAPRPIDLHMDNVVCGSYGWGNADSLAHWVRSSDVVIANGYVLHAHPELAQINQPLVLDLYDPTLFENLELFRQAQSNERIKRTRQDVLLLQQQLATGDFFLCATERQRDLYLGALMATGRITPDCVDADPQLRNLIDVVSFGLPSEPPVKQRPVLRGVLPGIGADDVVLLWTGGLWDWMDPLTLVQAMPQVVAKHPSVRLVLLAGSHPGNVHPMRMPQETKNLAESLGLLNRYVFFYEQWIPYLERADFLLEADIAISLHRDHLETAYAAVRSRLLDHLWAGLPSIITDGDAAAELFRTAQAGTIVPPEDCQRLVTAILDLLNQLELRIAQTHAAQLLAQKFTWDKVLTPLMRFCQAPRHIYPLIKTDLIQMMNSGQIENQQETVYTETTSLSTDQVLFAARNAATAVLERTWRIHERSQPGSGLRHYLRRFVINQFVRPFVMPLIEQQQEYNAAVLRSMYTLAEITDRFHTRLDDAQGEVERAHARLDDLGKGLHSLNVRLNDARGEVERAHARLDDLGEGLHGLNVRLNDAWGEVERSHARLDDFGQGLQQMNEQVLHQRHLVSQTLDEIAEQLAGLEEADDQLRALLDNTERPAVRQRQKTRS